LAFLYFDYNLFHPNKTHITTHKSAKKYIEYFLIISVLDSYCVEGLVFKFSDTLSSLFLLLPNLITSSLTGSFLFIIVVDFIISG